MKSTAFKKKSLSPLISTILLVVVAVILVTLILTWGKDFVNTNLDDTQAFGNLVSSDATHFIFSPSIKDNILKFNYTPPESLKNENLVITHYTVLEISDIDEPISLHDSITLYPGINLITLNGLYAYSADTSDLTIQLIASNNTFLIIKVNDPNIVCVTKGNGSEEDPYVICTADDLNNIRNNKEGNNIIGNYVLGKNIDLDISPYNQGSGFEPIGNTDISNIFIGSFNGNNHIIKNLYIKTVYNYESESVGFFGDVNNATITNIRLRDVNIFNDSRYTEVGGLIGSAENSLISNCSATGTISKGGRFGGLIGALGSTSKLINSYFDGNIYNDEYGLGGLVFEGYGEIINCYSTGNIFGLAYVGGLAEYYSGKIINSYSSMNINTSYPSSVGGLVGTNSALGIIENCYFNGSIHSSSTYGEDLGGIVGENRGQIINSYSVGYISLIGSSVGGLVGVNYSPGTITNSFYDTETSGQSDIGKGTLKSTTQMKTQSTFTGWDFTNVWAIDEGTTYPYLRNFTYNANNPKPA